MKKLLLCASFALPIIAPAVNAAPTKKMVRAKPKAALKVKWLTSFPGALAEAKRTGKPIFVDVFTTWCGPCKYLDAVTYKDPKFIAQSQNWIMVKLDAEKNSANAKLTQKFRVEGFPSMIFFKSNGKESGRLVGGYPPEILVPKMKTALATASGGTPI